jgi:hypothetical protein
MVTPSSKSNRGANQSHRENINRIALKLVIR